MENEIFDQEFNEYMDPDALSCLDDYNRYEENQIALDMDAGEGDPSIDDNEDECFSENDEGLDSQYWYF